MKDTKVASSTPRVVTSPSQRFDDDSIKSVLTRMPAKTWKALRRAAEARGFTLQDFCLSIFLDKLEASAVSAGQYGPVADISAVDREALMGLLGKYPDGAPGLAILGRATEYAKDQVAAVRQAAIACLGVARDADAAELDRLVDRLQVLLERMG